MNFFNRYINRNILFPRQIKELPSPQLGIIICIPCMDEKKIILTLESIRDCSKPQCNVEIIVLINEAENSPESVKNQNRKTFIELADWMGSQKNFFLKFYVLHQKNLPKKIAGVGLARKILMDEAVRRYSILNKPEGIIVSLDADTTCQKNYLTAIEQYYLKYPQTKAANIFFEHSIEGSEFSKKQYDAITAYELYLRYFVNALRWAGHPHAFQTVGSAFSVRADIYCKQGGMNKRQAGEDFYFLHKIIPLLQFGEINSTTVIPSSRKSNRVPFGTGKAVDDFLKQDLPQLNVYNSKSFAEIKEFFKIKNLFFKKEKAELLNLKKILPVNIRSYLQNEHSQESIDEINQNCASKTVFQQKFFKFFNVFWMIKFLNYSHLNVYQKKDVKSEAQLLLQTLGKWDNEERCKDLLLKFRKLDRSS